MEKKELISILTKARDKRLWDGVALQNIRKKEVFSCLAVYAAFGYDTSLFKKINIFLDRIEINLTYNGTKFSDVFGREARQGARYLWLTVLIEGVRSDMLAWAYEDL